MTKPDKGEYLDVDGIRTFYIKGSSRLGLEFHHPAT